MYTRRQFAAGFGMAAAAGRMLPEMAYAQRAMISGPLPKDMVWLNANENPEGPPRESIEAMKEALPTAGRYHYQEFGDFYTALARSEDLSREQVLVGAGSSEVLHCAVDAFTSPTQPMITISPTYEGPIGVANALGRKVISTPLTKGYYADVKRLVEEARAVGGGLVYLCNPNNPTGAVTPKADIAWLVANLPSNSVLLIDEAYLHFVESPEFESAVSYVRQGKNVVVTRTFSKIWGMAGLRAGYACGRPDLIARMAPYRDNVISWVTARAVQSAIENASVILPGRRTRLLQTRQELCTWLEAKGLPYIPSHANFVMIDLRRDVRELLSILPPKGLAVGRPFPPLYNFLRVSIGSDRDMARFREIFWNVYKG